MKAGLAKALNIIIPSRSGKSGHYGLLYDYKLGLCYGDIGQMRGTE